ncbi:hypothetical protein PROFUN_13628 [Planoprotostelium fungivorum]|uniref:Uncharacterized protein n=1 Tax=Planoprotostelium fungivorum TaxID=1890364 RepID=A0A2P6MZX0_9EUKA|nr:hypothetical protein PROFUN_13628 [Planoprotostelium fungivorum]
MSMDVDWSTHQSLASCLTGDALPDLYFTRTSSIARGLIEHQTCGYLLKAADGTSPTLTISSTLVERLAHVADVRSFLVDATEDYERAAKILASRPLYTFQRLDVRGEEIHLSLRMPVRTPEREELQSYALLVVLQSSNRPISWLVSDPFSLTDTTPMMDNSLDSIFEPQGSLLSFLQEDTAESALRSLTEDLLAPIFNHRRASVTTSVYK